MINLVLAIPGPKIYAGAVVPSQPPPGVLRIIKGKGKHYVTTQDGQRVNMACPDCHQLNFEFFEDDSRKKSMRKMGMLIPCLWIFCCLIPCSSFSPPVPASRCLNCKTELVFLQENLNSGGFDSANNDD
eukprot:GILI01081641.1.p2 GENE.GILI01081641.1~~GILI01081641.1.p2  ORF type:complete len:129 (+),score=10.68 GILI01081641.1:138-524(+)